MQPLNYDTILLDIRGKGMMAPGGAPLTLGAAVIAATANGCSQDDKLTTHEKAALGRVALKINRGEDLTAEERDLAQDRAAAFFPPLLGHLINCAITGEETGIVPAPAPEPPAAEEAAAPAAEPAIRIIRVQEGSPVLEVAGTDEAPDTDQAPAEDPAADAAPATV